MNSSQALAGSHGFWERMPNLVRETLSFVRYPNRSTSQNTWRILVLGGAIGATGAAHHLTPIELVNLHNVYQRLYYLPIFAAAYWFGFAGAMSASLLSALSYLPHILFDWRHMRGVHDEYLAAQYAELVTFQVVAFVVGLLAQSELRLRERQEKTARELADAYRELRESFQHLSRADRLSSLGELSAGIAHEIKNPLASIRGSLEIVAAEFPASHPKHEFVEIMEKELDQLNRIVTEFLDFARAPRPVRAPCDVREVIGSLKVLCSKEAARHSVELAVEAPEILPELSLDASQVQQALLNVVLNGIQAMPRGGRLAVALTPWNGGLRIEIRDQGPGIPLEQRPRIFDPFFTTKARGTGLGLPIARKLIRAQGGDILLREDYDGPGAAFVIELPSEGDHHE
jgi:signal transduction histidine kinase